MPRMSELDDEMLRQYQAAAEQNKVLRYVASLNCLHGELKAKVGIEWVDRDHPYANLTPGDNVLCLLCRVVLCCTES